MNDSHSEFTTAMDAGTALSQPRKAGDADYLVLPDGNGEYRLEDLQQFHPTPRRKETIITFDSAASLVDYTRLHKEDGTRLLVDLGGVKRRNPQLRATINHHTRNAAGWADHIAEYRFPVSPEWLVWTESDNTKMAQNAFAQFLEDNLPDIAEPDAAKLLELCKMFGAKINVAWESGTNLQDGTVQFVFREQIDGKGKGEMRMPEWIKLKLRVFDGDTEPVELPARLRFRIDRETGKLTLFYMLYRAHEVIEKRVREVVEQVARDTALDPWWVNLRD